MSMNQELGAHAPFKGAGASAVAKLRDSPGFTRSFTVPVKNWAAAVPWRGAAASELTYDRVLLVCKPGRSFHSLPGGPTKPTQTYLKF